MKITQLSLFLENQPGQLTAPCRLLADAGIDIRTLSLADTASFGILRLIVSDSPRAAALLEQAGYVVKLTEVVAIEVPDHPGGMSHVLSLFDDSGINIEYMYAFPEGRLGSAVLVFRFDRPDAALARLKEAGVNVVASVDAYPAS